MNAFSRKNSSTAIQIALIILIFAVAFLISNLVINQAANKEMNELRERVSAYSVSLQSRLTNEINESLNLVLGLLGFINIDPEPAQSDFEKFAKVIIQKSSIIRNIGLAPDNVIRYMYPVKGNEAAIGLDFMKTPGQKETVLEAIEKRGVVIAGPLELVQGGIGLIARVPIFLDYPSEYWGIASIVVDFEKLLEVISIDSENKWLHIGIRGKDGKGLTGEMVYGDEELFDKKPFLTNVELPDGNWVIAAVPVSGWKSGRSFWSYPVLWVSLVVAAVISLLVSNLMISHRRMSYQALYDPLTSLANRRLLQLLADKAVSLSERSGSPLFVIYFDLDNFKEINDEHGHKTGDQVLQKIADEISSMVRAHDITARLGGDEFLVIPLQIYEESILIKLCEKIISRINGISDEMELKVKIGCSIGVSCFPEDGKDIDELIKNADHAMYKSKLNGKNRVSFFKDS